MLAWTRSSSWLVVVMLGACTPTPDEVSTSTADDESSDDTSATTAPTVTTTAGTTTPGTSQSGEGTMGPGTDTSPTTGPMMTTADETTVGESSATGESESSSEGGPSPCVEPGCGSNEVCDQDLCVDACGGLWGVGSYGYCLDEYGVVDTADACGPDHTCVYWGDPIEQTACSSQGCNTACDCPPPPATGTATVSCGQITDPPGMNDCYLGCGNGESCPDDMTCINGVCTTDAPEVAMYGDCGNLVSDCAGVGFCVEGNGAQTACSQTCLVPGDCPAAIPPGGNAVIACTDITNDVAGLECYLSCIGGAVTCPDGMICYNGTLCLWPD